MKYGGLGGFMEGRETNPDDLFEKAVADALGDRIHDDEIASQMWSALANVDWRHINGDTASYSFRAAGDLIAAIRGEGCYMDWYCSGPTATISETIRTAMATQGWEPLTDSETEVDFV